VSDPPVGLALEAAAELCATMLARRVASIRGTDRPTAFLIQLEDGATAVLKVARSDRTASPLVEAWMYDRCRQSGITVPEVLAVSECPEAIVLRALPGKNLWEQGCSEDPGAWAAAGADLRTLHDICVPGFGPLTACEGGVSGVAPRWSPVVEFARSPGLEELARRELVTAAEASCLARRYDELEPHLRDVADGRLLHGDLQSGHILVDAERSYLGIIDFDQAQAGDPRWDFARIGLWDGDGALDLLLRGYGGDSLTSEDRDLVLPLYLLAFCIHHIVHFPFSADPGFAAELLRRSNYSRLL
jgi:aminoglycoside phosphotransferase